MVEYKRISIDDAKSLIDADKVTLADIRDEDSFKQSHINGAVHLHNSNVQDFLATADPDKPLIVYCYHGNSSLSAAQFLIEKGFDDVYSMDGGYEQWRSKFADK